MRQSREDTIKAYIKSLKNTAFLFGADIDTALRKADVTRLPDMFRAFVPDGAEVYEVRVLSAWGGCADIVPHTTHAKGRWYFVCSRAGIIHYHHEIRYGGYDDTTQAVAVITRQTNKQ